MEGQGCPGHIDPTIGHSRQADRVGLSSDRIRSWQHDELERLGRLRNRFGERLYRGSYSVF
jgi:hypothetical protein